MVENTVGPLPPKEDTQGGYVEQHGSIEDTGWVHEKREKPLLDASL